MDRVRERNDEVQGLILQAFLAENMFSIMFQLAALSHEQNVERQDLLLEVDFANNLYMDLPAPALRQKCKFNVTTFREYMANAHVGNTQRNWFMMDTDPANKDKFRTAVTAMRHARQRPDAVLLCVRFPDDYYSCHMISTRSDLPDGPGVFTDKALGAMYRAVKESDASGLEEIFLPSDLERFEVLNGIEEISLAGTFPPEPEQETTVRFVTS